MKRDVSNLHSLFLSILTSPSSFLDYLRAFSLIVTIVVWSKAVERESRSRGAKQSADEISELPICSENLSGAIWMFLSQFV